MSYSVKNSISGQENGASSSGDGSCCSSASSQLKIYQAFIFSFFTFVLLFLFYCFYLRRRRADWSSLRMRANPISATSNDISRCELGLKKELREMLPIIVFKESFSIKDTQCSVCLGEYEAEDRLQQIPACGHSFYMDCIDLWLTTHTTCPLCRQSLLATTTHQHHQDDPLQLQLQTQISEQELPPHTHTDDHEPPLDESTHTHPDIQRGVLEIVK